jgi:hypothetical protein
MTRNEIANIPTLDDLESLFVNNPDLDTIRSHLSRFNPIKTMGMEQMEIRHSAILGWLLSPQETHGLGDTFLKAFLSQSLRGHDISKRPTALEVSQSDMMDAEVKREWRHVDLIILSPRNKWVFVIENKFNSSQHTNQLKRYMEVINSSFMDGETYCHLRGIFLTLWNEEPEDKRYAPIDYATICELIQQTALSGRIPLTAEVKTFLEHYLEIILEATNMSNEQKEMEKIARQLYRDHRRVIDFVIEHGKSTDFVMACKGLIGKEVKYPDDITIGNQRFVFGGWSSNTISFLPESWYKALGEDDFYWHGCETWWAKFPVIMWVQLSSDAEGGSGDIRLYAEVGPLKNHDFRRELIEEMQKVAKEKKLDKVAFQKGATDEGKKYSKIFKNNRFPVDDVQDHEQIANTIVKAINSFQTEIEAIASVLPQFVKYGSKKS